MNAVIPPLLLGVVVAWPLLLAFPALYARVPWPRQLATVPALLLAVLPGEASLELSWLLFGTGFAIDGQSRWILATAVAVWLMAAVTAQPANEGNAGRCTTPFFMLTLGGNLGAILATDLVGFFSFATVMGYGFYGLLIQGSDEAARRSGRCYLLFLIVADLLLFEALLLAAFTAEDLRYETVGEAMVGASSMSLYLWLVLIGFMLKAGVWPLHWWLTAAFCTSPRTTALLLGGVPVAMGLLGLLRWLPLGEYAAGGSVMLIQVMGAGAVLYAVFARGSVKTLPARVAVSVTGLFVVALGSGLAYPAVWRQYEFIGYPFIASLGILLAGLGFTTGRMKGARYMSTFASRRLGALQPEVGRWIEIVYQWAGDRFSGLHSLWRVSWLKAVKWRIPDWRNLRTLVEGWSATITLFVLLGLALAWLAG